MIRIVLWLIGVSVIAFATVQVAAHKAPGFIMSKAVEKLESGYNTGPNEFAHSAPITAQNQRVVRPSPDLAYSICLYDLSDGPVEVAVPKAAGYISVALYDMNTDNYFHINDSEMEKDRTSVLIVKKGKNASVESQTQTDIMAASPTVTGLVLVRRVFANEADWAVIQQERTQMLCRAV